MSVLLGYGDGGFAPYVDFTTGEGYGSRVAVADFNGDGFLDLAVADSFTSGSVSVYLGFGDGGFATSANLSFSTGMSPIAVAVGDFNRDGIPDLVTGNTGNNTVSVLLGQGCGP